MRLRRPAAVRPRRGNDSAATARVHAMRSLLLRADAYERLLKMSETEILGFLQGSAYREDVDRLAITQLSEPEAIDRVLARNADRTVSKLDRIGGVAFRDALRSTLHANDRWNLKVIAEVTASGTDPQDALARFGRFGTVRAERYTGARDIGQLSRLASGVVSGIGGATSLPVMLERLAAPTLVDDDPVMPSVIDEANIIAIIKAKRERVAQERIVERLLPGGTVRKATLRAAAQASDMAGTLQVLRATRYRLQAERALDALKDGTLVRFEHELHAAVLERIRDATRTKPLGTDVLIRYLAELEQEHANVRLIVKGKRLGLDEAFLREHLVVA